MFTFSGVLFAQTKVESETKSIKVEKVELKTVEKSKTNSSATEHKSATPTEPVIIQRLEYKAEDNSVQSNDIENQNKEIEMKISNLDSYINAIDQKVNFVKNIPEKDQKAKESGWYDQMDKNRNEAVAEREELVKSKK